MGDSLSELLGLLKQKARGMPPEMAF